MLCGAVLCFIVPGHSLSTAPTCLAICARQCQACLLIAPDPLKDYPPPTNCRSVGTRQGMCPCINSSVAGFPKTDFPGVSLICIVTLLLMHLEENRCWEGGRPFMLPPGMCFPGVAHSPGLSYHLTASCCRPHGLMSRRSSMPVQLCTSRHTRGRLDAYRAPHAHCTPEEAHSGQ